VASFLGSDMFPQSYGIFIIMKNNHLQLIGWLGMVMILIGYFLMTFSFISSQGFIYQSLNIVGSFGIILVTWKRKDYQPMLLNIIWMIIAIVAIGRILF
jgi:hypothetical protein